MLDKTSSLQPCDDIEPRFPRRFLRIICLAVGFLGAVGAAPTHAQEVSQSTAGLHLNVQLVAALIQSEVEVARILRPEATATGSSTVPAVLPAATLKISPRALSYGVTRQPRTPCPRAAGTQHQESAVDLQGASFEEPEGFIAYFLNTELGEIVAAIPVLPMATLGGLSLEARVDL